MPSREDLKRVALDSSVLLGRWRRQIVAAAHLHRFHGYWSSWIVAEVVRKRTEWIAARAVREGADTVETARRLDASRAKINDLIRDLSTVLPSVDYRNAPPADLSWLADPDDLPVLQTALAAGAEILVTANRRDFPWGEERNGILFLSAEAFLDWLYESCPGTREIIEESLNS